MSLGAGWFLCAGRHCKENKEETPHAIEEARGLGMCIRGVAEGQGTTWFRDMSFGVRVPVWEL